MQVPPFPVLPSPRTWTAGDPILIPYLRGDVANAALLLANRPMFVGQQNTTAQTPPSGAWTPIQIDTEQLDAYGGHTNPNASWGPPNPATGPLGGWYLIEGMTETASMVATATLGVGMRVVQNGVTNDAYCGIGPGNGAGNDVGSTGALLAQLDSTTADRCSMIANPGAAVAVTQATLKAEWVALPSTLAYGNPIVVTSPQPAALWPDGAGTTITDPGGIAAGATSVNVFSNVGMVVGGTLGLDYLHGQPVSPMAETVTITSVTGLTIGITATSYPHGGVLSPGIIAVPVSASFLNQQVRDMIRFLSFPPIAALHSPGVGFSIPTQAFPAGTPIPFTVKTVDNFTGWSGTGTGSYTSPVSGVFYVYGQVAAQAASSYTLCAGLQVNSAAVQWGDTVRNPNGATPLQMTATVRRHLRVNAGDTIQLWGSQNSGSPLTLNNGFQQTSRLIVVFRSF